MSGSVARWVARLAHGPWARDTRPGSHNVCTRLRAQAGPGGGIPDCQRDQRPCLPPASSAHSPGALLDLAEGKHACAYTHTHARRRTRVRRVGSCVMACRMALLVEQALACDLPQRKRARDVNVEGAEQSRLRDLDACIYEGEQRGRYALLLRTEQQHDWHPFTSPREVELVQRHAASGLLDGHNSPPSCPPCSEVVAEIGPRYFLERQPALGLQAERLEALVARGVPVW